MDQLLGVRDRQRLQQDGIHNGEDAGVGADAEGEREDDGRREAAILDQHARGELHILKQTVHEVTSICRGYVV